LLNAKINLLIGTHALFQKKINFKKLGLVVIDEQHKFGVKQRSDLAIKGGDNCDVLLMSATPIPRTMMMSLYGDMDISKITEKPLNRKKILTLSKPENKIDELWPFIEKQIEINNQVFWVCPLIEDSAFLNYSSAKKKFEIIKRKFKNKVGLIHGALEKDDKEEILKKFLEKKISILVSTTVIEVGIDFPNANLIIIENANKFGLAQLHQLRGRVGRGIKQGTCILLFKDGLSKNAIKRIKILKESDDGFFIAEEDLKLRGFGDLIGYQQSGIKNFRFADPIHHVDLFDLADKFVKNINEEVNQKNYSFLLKLFDRAEIINSNDF
jgi:ATP-dependent DNA helicase RecG